MAPVSARLSVAQCLRLGSSESVFLRVGTGAVYKIGMAECGERREGVTVLSEGQLERLADLISRSYGGEPGASRSERCAGR